MATQVINHTYRLKRGKEDAINRVNPILEAGEPIVVFCKDGSTKIKIGDGVTSYLDLEFVGERGSQEVITYPTHFDFPNPPSDEQINSIFKATNEAKLWQWNDDKFRYELLNNVEVDVIVDDIDIISGGTALDLIKA